MERAIAAQPLQADETLAGWVVVLRDVTDARHHLEWQVRQERLATAGQLAAGIAHDFNNILTPILLYAELGVVSTPGDSRLAPETKILAISGGGRFIGMETLTLAQRLGADQVLAKPFSRQQVLDISDSLLHHPSTS